MLVAEQPNPEIKLLPCGSATVQLVDEHGKPIANKAGLANLYFVAAPGATRYDAAAYRAGKLIADEDFMSNVHGGSYPDIKTDSEGRVFYPALIPGATYRHPKAVDGKWSIAKEFKAESGKTFDIGKIVVELDE